MTEESKKNNIIAEKEELIEVRLLNKSCYQFLKSNQSNKLIPDS